MIDENFKEEFKKLKIQEENNSKKRLKNKTLELLSLKDEAITQIKASKVSV
ncbi:hypothetical protein [Candidatus Karelsulcia muelleri]|uniref:hypothetical protein n=1 Tax=Candidatus Karelsulcia muelleri TaxID=336810 RepID=UPI0013A6541B|nr:hypothetical protein [Candidatus Karelsulcia muelleri]